MDPIAPGAPKPLISLRPRSGWQALDLKQVWEFRDLLIALGTRDVKLRYRQTALGALWVVLQPLLAAGIFSVVFGTIAHLPSDGLPYFLFSYAGMLGWNAFNSTLTKASGCLIANAGLVSKIFFPRLILPLSTLFSTLLDFAIALVVLIVLLVIYRVNPGSRFFLLPLWVVLTLMLSLGLGLYTAALTVSYRDVSYILPVVSQLLLYASPIAYTMSAVPHRVQNLYLLNPLSGLMEGFRWSLLGKGHLEPRMIFYSASTSVCIFLIGAFSFKKMERKFADVI